eukprot:3433463-Rhodomonas_salina.2
MAYAHRDVGEEGCWLHNIFVTKKRHSRNCQQTPGGLGISFDCCLLLRTPPPLAGSLRPRRHFAWRPACSRILQIGHHDAASRIGSHHAVLQMGHKHAPFLLLITKHER